MAVDTLLETLEKKQNNIYHKFMIITIIKLRSKQVNEKNRINAEFIHM